MQTIVCIHDVLTLATQQLAASHIPSARLDARLLLAHVMSVEPAQLLIDSANIVSHVQYHQFQQLLQRRMAFEPVSRIIGHREFWGLNFHISAATLDPRPDSETLVQSVLRHTDNPSLPLSILDLGTGSGCLLLALLHELPHARGFGIDISADAINVARQNAGYLALAARVHFQQHDWHLPLHGHYDWIISNPPYIPHGQIAALEPDVRLYDPLLALDGGDDGLDCYRKLALIMMPLLKPGGKCAIEVGYNQATAVEDLLSAQGYIIQQWEQDLTGISRCGVFTCT